MSGPSLLSVRDLKVHFAMPRRSLFAPREKLHAVDGVSIDVNEAETLGLVGESGCGKSTVGRSILGMNRITQGTVEFMGKNISNLNEANLRPLRRHMQMVFQDPYSSLTPSMVIAEALREPLDIHNEGDKTDRNARVRAALARVELGEHILVRYPSELSGGQRQRVAIARALMLNPKFIVADEAVSALDVSTQSQIAQLFRQLQHDLGLSFLFISHDLMLVRLISHRVAVMYLGQLVETGPSERVVSRPAHPYTAALQSAVYYPNPRLQRQRKQIVLDKDLPSPIDPPSGCRFRTRCPWAMDVCREEQPLPNPVEGGGHVACHLQSHGLRLQGAPLPDTISIPQP